MKWKTVKDLHGPILNRELLLVNSECIKGFSCSKELCCHFLLLVSVIHPTLTEGDRSRFRGRAVKQRETCAEWGLTLICWKIYRVLGKIPGLDRCMSLKFYFTLLHQWHISVSWRCHDCRCTAAPRVDAGVRDCGWIYSIDWFPFFAM